MNALYTITQNYGKGMGESRSTIETTLRKILDNARDFCRDGRGRSVEIRQQDGKRWMFVTIVY